jgi:hypothetical protein
LCRRGVSLRFVFGPSDPSLTEIDHLVGVRWLDQQPGVSCDVLTGVDHAMLTRLAQTTFCEQIVQAFSDVARADIEDSHAAGSRRVDVTALAHPALSDGAASLTRR